MDLLIKDAIIVDPSSSYHNKKVAIKVKNNIITEIGENLIDDTIPNLELENLHLSKGWMDSSVAFGEPGFEERETIAHGLDVAAKSGFTNIALQPNTNPIIDNQTIVSFVQSKAIGSACTLNPIGALTKQQEGKDISELYDMKNAGAIAFGDYKKTIENANLLKIALQYSQDFNALIIAFCNDSSIKGKGVVHEGIISTMLGLKGIPALAEEIVVARNLFLLEYTGGKMHIPTISTAKSVLLIKEAKAKGLQVTCSVAVHNLFLTDNVLNEFDTRFKVNPPLRTSDHRLALIEGVLDDTIDCITSDHHPLDIEHKKMEFDLAKDGTIGLESAFGALSKILPLEVLIAKLNAAKDIFEIDNTSIEVNQPACFTLFNPEGFSNFNKQAIISKSLNSAFLNQELKGEVYGILNNGILNIKK